MKKISMELMLIGASFVVALLGPVSGSAETDSFLVSNNTKTNGNFLRGGVGSQHKHAVVANDNGDDSRKNLSLEMSQRELFGGEDMVKGNPWWHTTLSEEASKEAGFSKDASERVAWHALYTDFYIYNPFYWFGTSNFVNRFKAAMSIKPDLLKAMTSSLPDKSLLLSIVTCLDASLVFIGQHRFTKEAIKKTSMRSGLLTTSWE